MEENRENGLVRNKNNKKRNNNRKAIFYFLLLFKTREINICGNERGERREERKYSLPKPAKKGRKHIDKASCHGNAFFFCPTAQPQ